MGFLLFFVCSVPSVVIFSFLHLIDSLSRQEKPSESCCWGFVVVKSDFAGHRIFSGEYQLAVCIWHSKPNALFGQCRPGICQRPIGVIDNYYRQGLDHPIVPEFYLLEPEPATTVLVNVPTGQMANVQKQLKVIWSRLFNEQKEEFYQGEQMLQSEYHQHRVLMGITLMAGFIMLILSLCGLGCLQLYLLHCRRKELAIRQVMGQHSPIRSNYWAWNLSAC